MLPHANFQVFAALCWVSIYLLHAPVTWLPPNRCIWKGSMKFHRWKWLRNIMMTKKQTTWNTQLQGKHCWIIYSNIFSFCSRYDPRNSYFQFNRNSMLLDPRMHNQHHIMCCSTAGLWFMSKTRRYDRLWQFHLVTQQQAFIMKYVDCEMHHNLKHLPRVLRFRRYIVEIFAAFSAELQFVSFVVTRTVGPALFRQVMFTLEQALTTADTPSGWATGALKNQ